MIGATFTNTGIRKAKPTTVTFGDTAGENTRDAPSRTPQPEIVENYFIEGDGRYVAREGLTSVGQIDMVVTVNTVTGVFTAGETVTGGTSTATAIVVAYLSLTGTTGVLYLKTEVGTIAAAEVLTGGSSSATGTSVAVRRVMRSTLLRKLTDDILVFGFQDSVDSHLCTFTVSTALVTGIRTFTGSTAEIAGRKFGNLFYASNGSEKIGTFHATAKFLNYGTQTGNFTVGLTVTDGMSGATGVILADVDNGTSGTLLLGSVTGVFGNTNTITDTSSGSAAAVGTTFDFFTITDAPKAKVLEIYTRTGRGSHLVAANTDDGNGFVDSRIQWCTEHTDPLTVPFLDWTASVPPVDGDAGTSLLSAGGEVFSLTSHKNRINVFSQDATGVFHLERIDVATVGSSQISITDDAELNFGGFRGGLSTPFGVAYGNENGLFFNNFVQGDNLASEITKVIKDQDIETFDFRDMDIMWDGKERIYFTFGRDSSTNNYVKVFNTEEGSLSSITGWGLARFARLKDGSDNELYGIGAREVKIFKLLDGFGDDGADTNWRVRYKQETGGDQTLLKTIVDSWHQGILSPTSVLKISFSIWDRLNVAQEGFKEYFWIGTDVNSESIGYDATEFDSLIQRGDILVSENFVHRRYPIANFLKYQIEISSSGQVGHEIHMPYQVETVSTERVHLNNAIRTTETYVIDGDFYILDGDTYVII